MLFFISVVSDVVSLPSFMILFIWVFFFPLSLAQGLYILIIFSKNSTQCALLYCFASLYWICFCSAVCFSLSSATIRLSLPLFGFLKAERCIVWGLFSSLMWVPDFLLALLLLHPIVLVCYSSIFSHCKVLFFKKGEKNLEHSTKENESMFPRITDRKLGKI